MLIAPVKTFFFPLKKVGHRIILFIWDQGFSAATHDILHWTYFVAMLIRPLPKRMQSNRCPDIAQYPKGGEMACGWQ